ncbi:hypothetical protein [Paenibacillus sp. MBLB4367]|uniref:hypothetical protein n=1 Tax=Paenibacillus sp. MBLB4367 TaxID=3384767 RepID=UPI003908145C
MAKVSLEKYRFTGLHKSHIGALKSCLEYLNKSCSAAWLYGMTGSAFLTVIDEKGAAPNIGEPQEEAFALARHLGLDIRGYQAFADAAAFERLQREAWDAARAALERGLPVFARELDLGNETSVVYGCDEEGYYTHSWHAGSGHEGFDAVIPWTKLGRNYCPCASCRRNAGQDGVASDGVYTGNPHDGGFISLHWASPAEPSDEHTAFRAALSFALEFSQRGKYEWAGRAFYSGLSAYDRWIELVRKDAILGFHMGYFTDILHESRHNAYLFLLEASERFEGALGRECSGVAEAYKRIKEEYQALNELFPWMQSHAPIEDPDRRQEAVERLARLKKLESEGYVKLERLLSILQE